MGKNTEGKILVVSVGGDEEAEELSEGLINRIIKSGKEQRLVNGSLNMDSQGDPKAYDIKKLQDILDHGYTADTENDVLSLVSHGNIEVIGGKRVDELFNDIKDFIEQTGIQHVKLVSCYSGSRFKPEHKPNGAPEEFTKSYAQRLSEMFANNGIRNITVYGYHGAHTDKTEGARKNKEYHSYVEVDVAHKKKRKTTYVEKTERASDQRVAFRDGREVDRKTLPQEEIAIINARGERRHLSR